MEMPGNLEKHNQGVFFQRDKGSIKNEIVGYWLVLMANKNEEAKRNRKECMAKREDYSEEQKRKWRKIV